MKKLLIYVCFGILTGGIVVVFLTAKTYIHLAAASALYPLIAFIGYKLFLDTRVQMIANKQGVTIQATRPPAPQAKQNKGLDILDIDKRAFLKLVGGAGLSFFLFSLLARKAENVLFPQVGLPSVSGDEGITSPTQAMAGYRISEVDETDNVTFYGFINKDGAWFIMKEDPINGTFRYTKDDHDFVAGWNRRKTLEYDYYHNLF